MPAASVVPWRRPPTVVHVPVTAWCAVGPLPSKKSVRSIVISAAITVSAMLSNNPRAWSEPKPTRPLLSATCSPPRMRGAKVWERAFLPLTVTVTTSPLITTLRS